MQAIDKICGHNTEANDSISPVALLKLDRQGKHTLWERNLPRATSRLRAFDSLNQYKVCHNKVFAQCRIHHTFPSGSLKPCPQSHQQFNYVHLKNIWKGRLQVAPAGCPETTHSCGKGSTMRAPWGSPPKTITNWPLITPQLELGSPRKGQGSASCEETIATFREGKEKVLHRMRYCCGEVNWNSLMWGISGVCAWGGGGGYTLGCFSLGNWAVLCSYVQKPGLGLSRYAPNMCGGPWGSNWSPHPWTWLGGGGICIDRTLCSSMRKKQHAYTHAQSALLCLKI